MVLSTKQNIQEISPVAADPGFWCLHIAWIHWGDAVSLEVLLNSSLIILGEYLEQKSR